MKKTAAILMIAIYINLSFLTACKTAESDKNENYKIEYQEIVENQTVTYMCNDAKYLYKVRLQGRSSNAKYDSYYIVLTNNKTLTFDEADKQFWSSDKSNVTDCIVEWGILEQTE